MQEPVRVLHLFTILNRGGAETNVMNYYRKLDKSKIQFDFVVHREEKGAYEDEILALGGKIFRFQNINPFKLKSYKLQIKAFFDIQDYQIIHGQCSELGYFFYKEAHKRRVPVIIAHGHNSKSKLDLKFPFRWFWKKSMMRYVNTYFSCGEEASVWLFGKKIAPQAFTMTNAIDSQLFAYNEEKSLQIQKELSAEQTKNFIHIGRFNVQKNHEFLIEVFHLLLQKNPQQQLFLVGEGELKSQIQKKVKTLGMEQKVIFLGSRNDVNDLLQAMDVFLFPSLFEGLPVSLVEAQASGVQCVISDGIPIEAILIPENITVISLKESVVQWANKIHALNQFDKKDVSFLIKEKGYDIGANVRILEEKYTALLQGK
ncbi:glycosyltransferase family 1 protein [Flavobacterium sp. GSA192]|uniref:glycosyltransferase family 1 protein n=1 Tax=Flavobacterium sp. GSA192 TaxID=2576304 RepID=UPI001129BA98|nr:glycosyltransferase family 1 protein [Flavobacterium sp. GSA192]